MFYVVGRVTGMTVGPFASRAEAKAWRKSISSRKFWRVVEFDVTRIVNPWAAS